MTVISGIPTDIKYLHQISSHLLLYKQKKKGLWNFRCPFCGDSEKDKTKSRGFLYESKNTLSYKCHNCGISMTFNNFLKRIDTELHKEYIFERFKYDNDRRWKKEVEPGRKKEIEIQKNMNAIFKKNTILQSLPSINDLALEHPARKYVESRKIPYRFWSKLRYADKFNEFASKYDTSLVNECTFDEPRLVIPYFDKKGNDFMLQGRSFKKDTKLRYITVKPDKKQPQIFGQERLDLNKTIYVVEGPIDSLFLPNAVAVGNAFLSDIKKLTSIDKFVLIFDSERRNKETAKLLKTAIEGGFKVCIWPDDMKYKDINEMILNGYSSSDIISIINKNTVSGLQALTRFQFWKRCKIS